MLSGCLYSSTKARGHGKKGGRGWHIRLRRYLVASMQSEEVGTIWFLRDRQFAATIMIYCHSLQQICCQKPPQINGKCNDSKPCALLRTFTPCNHFNSILYFRLQVNELAAQRDRHGEHGVQEATGRGQGRSLQDFRTMNSLKKISLVKSHRKMLTQWHSFSSTYSCIGLVAVSL